jgi:hypothetical protein
VSGAGPGPGKRYIGYATSNDGLRFVKPALGQLPPSALPANLAIDVKFILGFWHHPVYFISLSL